MRAIRHYSECDLNEAVRVRVRVRDRDRDRVRVRVRVRVRDRVRGRVRGRGRGRGRVTEVRTHQTRQDPKTWDTYIIPLLRITGALRSRG